MYKKYEDKIKMVQEQWLQLKTKFFYWVITWKFLFSGGDDLLVLMEGGGGGGGGEGQKFGEEEVYRGDDISWWSGWANFRLVRGLLPVEKTLLSLTIKAKKNSYFYNLEKLKN